MNWCKIIGFVLLLLGIGAYAQEKENDWTKEDLRGKVKSILTIEYKIDRNNTEKRYKNRIL